MEEKSYTFELLGELKQQSRRWFITVLAVIVVFGIVGLVQAFATLEYSKHIIAIEQELQEHMSTMANVTNTISTQLEE